MAAKEWAAGYAAALCVQAASDLGASIAIDFHADGDFDDTRCGPRHMSSPELLTTQEAYVRMIDGQGYSAYDVRFGKNSSYQFFAKAEDRE